MALHISPAHSHMHTTHSLWSYQIEFVSAISFVERWQSTVFGIGPLIPHLRYMHDARKCHCYVGVNGACSAAPTKICCIKYDQQCRVREGETDLFWKRKHNEQQNASHVHNIHVVYAVDCLSFACYMNIRIIMRLNDNNASCVHWGSCESDDAGRP